MHLRAIQFMDFNIPHILDLLRIWDLVRFDGTTPYLNFLRGLPLRP